MNEFPSNPKNPQPANSEPQRRVEQVVTGEVQVRKKSLGKRLKDIFIGGDSRSVLHYIVMDVLVPQAKDMITEAASQGFERLIYGEHRPGRRYPASHRSGAPTNYTRYAVRGNNPIGRAGRGEPRRPLTRSENKGLDDILLATRVEAETVLERLYDLLNQYDNASVSDLYSLVGLSSSFTDQKWGWTDLKGARVIRVHDGYVLDLPQPEALD